MKEQTVSLGTKIVAANEKLTSITMIDLYEMIAHSEIRQKSCAVSSAWTAQNTT